jgi:hypothetical protein
MRNILKPAVGLGFAAAMALSVAPAAAAPVLTNTTAVKAAVPDDATQVRSRGRAWRGHGWVPGAAAGLAAGAVIGGAVAASPYYHGGYYAHDPYYTYPYPGAYAYSPALTLPRAYYDRDCFSGYDSAGVPCF